MDKLLVRTAVGLVAILMIAPAAGARELTFEERVAAQTAIEQVYWNHRVWPAENSGTKPSVSSVMSDAAIRAKVADYLKKSNAFATIWGQPITAEQLQAELDRMTSQTRAPVVLQEIFTALGSDPVGIAETLARQKLADRLIRDQYAFDDRLHSEASANAHADLATCDRGTCMQTMRGEYTETTWRLRPDVDPAETESSPLDGEGRAISLDEEEWNEHLSRLAAMVGGTIEALQLMTLSPLEETAEAFVVTAVLAAGESELTTATSTWPKRSFDSWWDAQSVGFDGTASTTSSDSYTLRNVDSAGCVPDSWTETPLFDMLAPRSYHTAIWTGAEMIVWGGVAGIRPPFLEYNTGGRYDPATDSWLTTSTLGQVPSRRYNHTAVWTGTEMIIWGGYSITTNSRTFGGGRYNPATDSWLETSTGTNVPAARSSHAAVWTGTEMIVWGGSSGSTGAGIVENTGGRYNPTTDSWLATSKGAKVPTARAIPRAIWTGTEMIVWGGAMQGSVGLNTGGRYSPASDTWLATSTGVNLPATRYWHTAVWTGTEMIVWGGYSEGAWLDTGGRYRPASDSWVATSTGTNVPLGRSEHSALWTGTEMIVWGGQFSSNYPNAGGRYSPAIDSWFPTSTGTNVPAPRAIHTAVWTGTEIIVWGGHLFSAFGQITYVTYNTGGRYCVASCTSPTRWYQDNDSDGAGILSVSVDACTQPPGFGAVTGDCDEDDPNVYPGATEICNGVDDDCDGLADDGGDALCGDGNSCTLDVCAPVAGCTHDPRPLQGALCGDPMLDECTAPDTCDGLGQCMANHEPQGTSCSDDGNSCTLDACEGNGTCLHIANDTCGRNPRSQGYWRRLCAGPHSSGEFISPFDLECVNDMASFSHVTTIAEICSALTPDPSIDKCGQAEGQFLSLILNVCRGRISLLDPIDSHCGSQVTVGQSTAEADDLLSQPDPTRAQCVLAQCLSDEINTGTAFDVDSLRLSYEDGAIRLTWNPACVGEQPRSDTYKVWRRTPDGAWQLLAPTTSETYLDTTASGHVYYEVSVDR